MLADAFGKGEVKRRLVNGRNQWGMNFSGTSIWCSRYKNQFGYSWIALPGTEEYLSVFGQLAAQNSLHLKLYSAELAFDFACHKLSYGEAEILRNRLASRMASVLGRSVRAVDVSGDLQHCRDRARNGKHTTYLHALDKTLNEKTGKRNAGKYISAKSKVYCKELQGEWNIRAEITLYVRRQAKHKRHIPFLPRELERLTMLIPGLSFYDFWGLNILDHTAFRDRVLQLAKRKWEKVPPYLYSLLNQCISLSFHEQRLKMKEIAEYIGSKRLSESLSQFYRSVTWEEAFDAPLGDEILPVGPPVKARNGRTAVLQKSNTTSRASKRQQQKLETIGNQCCKSEKIPAHQPERGP